MNDEKLKKLEMNTKNLLELLGEDPSREGLLNTPKRVTAVIVIPPYVA